MSSCPIPAHGSPDPSLGGSRPRTLGRHPLSYRQSTIVAVAFVAFLSVLVAFSWDPPEPKYKGKKISFWVRGIRVPNRDADRFVSAAIDAGPAAVPFLAKEFRHQNSRLRRSALYARWWSSLPAACQKRIDAPVLNAGSMPALAYTLGKLGPQARDAVPVLARGAEDRESEVRYFSIWALGQIATSDPGSVLSNHLSDSDSRVRDQASRALQSIEYSKQRAK